MHFLSICEQWTHFLFIQLPLPLSLSISSTLLISSFYSFLSLSNEASTFNISFALSFFHHLHFVSLKPLPFLFLSFLHRATVAQDPRHHHRTATRSSSNPTRSLIHPRPTKSLPTKAHAWPYTT
jgi:hypothetical protein